MHKLISITASHYVEKARWGLDLAGVEYEEERWPPLLHLLGTRLSSGTRTVPILRCPSGVYLTDSSDILHYVHESYPPTAALYPADPDLLRQVQDLESSFSKKLGVYARVTCYSYLFQNDAMCLAVLTQSLAPWKNTLFRAGWPVIKFMMMKGMRISPSSGASCLQKVRQVFGEVAETLSDGRKYLAGDQFTAADLTFAAMASPLLLPSGYGAQLPSVDQLPAGYPTLELRATPAGQHAMRMYDLHRRPQPHLPVAAQ
jgi:glutathione S-transferase